MTTQRYPLAWPEGWKRTATHARRRAAFHGHRTVRSTSNPEHSWKQKRPLDLAEALDRLTGEMRRLGAKNWFVSSDLRLRQDGFPVANQAAPVEIGVAVYFTLKDRQLVLACDAWDRIADNVAAVAGHVEAVRAQERYKVGTTEQAFRGYEALPAKGSTWRTTLGFGPHETPTKDAINEAFRQRAQDAHPDKQGGSHDAMASLTAARAEGLDFLQKTRTA